MAKVWFSIGSNINRSKNIRFAVSNLQDHFQSIQLSPVYQTQAVGFIGQDFYNLVGGFSTELAIHQIRDLFDQFEQQTGRIKSGRHFEDRTLDIDILLYDDLKYQDERLCIPHPDILEYDFILLPLSHLAADFKHPLSGRSLAEHVKSEKINPNWKVVELAF